MCRRNVLNYKRGVWSLSISPPDWLVALSGSDGWTNGWRRNYTSSPQSGLTDCLLICVITWIKHILLLFLITFQSATFNLVNCCFYCRCQQIIHQHHPPLSVHLHAANPEAITWTLAPPGGGNTAQHVFYVLTYLGSFFIKIRVVKMILSPCKCIKIS